MSVGKVVAVSAVFVAVFALLAVVFLWPRPPADSTNMPGSSPKMVRLTTHGTLNQSADANDTRVRVITYVLENATYKLTYSYSVSRERCDKSEEWEIEFEAEFEVNRTYRIVLIINETPIADELFVVESDNPPFWFEATFVAAWEGAIWEGESPP